MNQDTVKKYLEAEPRARERRNKDRALVNLLLQYYPQLEDIPKDTLVDIVHTYNNLDRYWRKTTSEHPHLRGNDYDTKKKVVQAKQIGLGYEGGYYEHLKHQV